ncbi:MAG: N-acetylmuramoyl-L-alanine amidase [Gammaproteobacteria bacterium]
MIRAQLTWILALAIVLSFAAPGSVRAGENAGAVSQFSLNQDRGATRAVLAVPKNLQYHVFTLANPARVVLDLTNARLAHGLSLSTGDNPLIADIRSASRFNGNGVRLVFDLHLNVTPHSFLRAGDNGEELVVEFGTSAKPLPKPMTMAKGPTLKPATTLAATVSQPVITEPVPVPVMTAIDAQPKRLRDVVVVIDPGHGGRDTGAIGPDGLEEKNVTLAIGKMLYAMLSKVPGIKPMLTRTGDYYVSLNGRRKIAHDDHADLFIAIHADSSPYHYPKGSSVYVLSEHGASSVAARILADSENSADQVAGVNLSDEAPMVRSTILNLSQSGTLIQSMQLARAIMDQINKSLPMHSSRVERADFVVLKSPDIPSILIETAFISNRKQEQELATTSFRARIATMIANGVENYANHYAPPGTLIAARRDAITTLKQG